MVIEVMFLSSGRVVGHQFPDVVQMEDGPLVRGLLKSGQVILIDPPILMGYNDHEFSEEEKEFYLE